MIVIPSILLPALIILFVWIGQSVLDQIFKNEGLNEITESIAKWTTWFCLIIYFFMLVNWLVEHIQIR